GPAEEPGQIDRGDTVALRPPFEQTCKAQHLHGRQTVHRSEWRYSVGISHDLGFFPAYCSRNDRLILFDKGFPEIGGKWTLPSLAFPLIFNHSGLPNVRDARLPPPPLVLALRSGESSDRLGVSPRAQQDIVFWSYWLTRTRVHNLLQENSEQVG